MNRAERRRAATISRLKDKRYAKYADLKAAKALKWLGIGQADKAVVSATEIPTTEPGQNFSR